MNVGAPGGTESAHKGLGSLSHRGTGGLWLTFELDRKSSRQLAGLIFDCADELTGVLFFAGFLKSGGVILDP